MRRLNSVKWLDLLKSVAILWIFLNHLVERIFGGPYIANPSANWPPLEVRLHQLYPADYGSFFFDVVLNFVRYLGWAGDQGVQLFLIASGFGLMWSYLRKEGSFCWKGFYQRRLGRIYPLWWGAHLMFLFLSLFVGGQGMQPFDLRFYFSMVGFRASSDMMYYFAPAWWYIGLMIQLYIVFPLLAVWLRRWRPARFLVLILGGALLVRLAGLYTFDGYLDAWSRGGIFVTRLPEFAFGMALAWWVSERPESTDRFLRRPGVLAVSLVVYAVATFLSLTLWGMAVAPFLQGVSVFVFLYSIFLSRAPGPSRFGRSLLWVGALSYPLYLTHHPIIAFLVERQSQPTLLYLAFGIPVFCVAVATAFFLERSVGKTQSQLAGVVRRRGWRWVVVHVLILISVSLGIMLGAEALVRTLDPQEVYGWGERPSLRTHGKFGWHLIPEQRTRLRWESYNYVVEANRLGFPGPSYSDAQPPDSLRILTLGDAFTSAEGVDTAQAWPRLLEELLAERLGNQAVEVLNFAVTGHGPNQYFAVLEEYGFQFRPQLIVVGFFVNEFFDVLVSNDEFRRSIGFGLMDQHCVASYLEAAHLRRWLQLRVSAPIREVITRNPDSYGYFLGNFRSLEAGSATMTENGYEQVESRLRAMKQLSDGFGAEIILAMIPAPVQVCSPGDLVYYPRHVNLGHDADFDVDLPQRLTLQIAAEIGMPAYDLREPLQAVDTCPYQPRNMHWLAVGHQLVAEYLADVIVRDELAKRFESFDGGAR